MLWWSTAARWQTGLSRFLITGSAILQAVILHPHAKLRSLAEESWTVTNEHGNITVAGHFPSHVHLDLYAANVIDDPLRGYGDFTLRWISAQNWTYTSAPIAGLQRDKNTATWLVFDGLDTYTTITFCDSIVATTDNQFRQWSVDVSSALAECGDHDPVLSINFGAVPPIINKLNASGIETWPDSVVVPFEYPNRQWVRKQQSDFGWDWGPAFIPTGPWRDGRIVQLQDEETYPLNVNVDVYREGQLNNIAPDQNRPWVVNASLDYIGRLPRHRGNLFAVISEAADPSKVLYAGQLSGVTHSDGTVTGSVTIGRNTPKLWWPRDMGPQELYSIKLCFGDAPANGSKSHYCDDGIESTYLNAQRRIGFRTILLDVGNVTDAQVANGYRPGNNWHFEINGQEFYAKGANMIPPDVFWPRVTLESGRMQRLFESAEAQNFNMLRVWSSGAYLPDFIYDLADERGILLWSEFQFSDSLYPDYPDFVRSVAAEVSYNVRRINHHPSLACWVGGNEFENLLLPSARADDPERFPYLLGQYEHLFIKVIFTILAENSRSISYTPSSANNGWTQINMSLPVPMVQRYNNKTQGDIYSSTDYYNYDSRVAFSTNHYPVGRFAVEFGFTSMPSLATWREAINYEDELRFNSTFVRLRNHHYPQNGLDTHNVTNGAKGLVEMTLAVERHFPKPNKRESQRKSLTNPFMSAPVANFSAWCHATQLFQADFYASQIAFYRRGSAMPERQMGALYWQLNDIWQAPTWSAIEHSGRWKVLPYMVRRAYEHVTANPFFDPASRVLEIWVTSDLWRPVQGSLSLTWLHLGEVWLRRGDRRIKKNAGMATELAFNVGPINSTRVLRVNLDDLAIPAKKMRNFILIMSLVGEGYLPTSGTKQRFKHRNYFLPVRPRDAHIVDPGLRLIRHRDSLSFTVEATGGVALYTWLAHPHDVIGFFDDNAFVLRPGEARHVGFTVQQDSSNGTWFDRVTVESLWDLKNQ